MYGEYLKCFISFIVAPIEVLFIPSPPALGVLHNDIIFVVYRWAPFFEDRNFRRFRKISVLHENCFTKI